MICIYEYFDNLYNHHFSNKEENLLEKIKKINSLISCHEEIIANPVLEYLSKNNKFKLIGKNKIKDKNRAPTISFYSKEISSKEISKKLVSKKIATRNDNFYAWRCLRDLGIDSNDGVVRISMTHYNSLNETNQLLKALRSI